MSQLFEKVAKFFVFLYVSIVVIIPKTVKKCSNLIFLTSGLRVKNYHQY